MNYSIGRLSNTVSPWMNTTRSFLKSSIAAISVGIVAGQVVADLDYVEDKDAEVDMNVVMLQRIATLGGVAQEPQFVEVQGSGEEATFSQEQLSGLLALAQTGALDSARTMLDEVLKESARDEETLCLLGRVYKELWRRAGDPAAAAEAREALDKEQAEARSESEKRVAMERRRVEDEGLRIVNSCHAGTRK